MRDHCVESYLANNPSLPLKDYMREHRVAWEWFCGIPIPKMGVFWSKGEYDKSLSFEDSATQT